MTLESKPEKPVPSQEETVESKSIVEEFKPLSKDEDPNWED